MKHTQGPWFKSANYHQSKEVVNEQGDSVCNTQPCNANLIAAAPEMLEALILAHQALNGDASASHASDEIEYAIKKAKGE